ncbi:MAG TPA: HAMP domain-containing sensor histidine kinase [Vicinamibacterales bacterium]
MAARVLERYRPIDGLPLPAAYVDAQGVILAENESFRALHRIPASGEDGTLAMLFVDGDRDTIRDLVAGRQGYRHAFNRLTMSGSHESMVAEFTPISRENGPAFWQVLLHPSDDRSDSAPELGPRVAVPAGIVHDLRAPVQVVLGWASLLRRKLDDPESVEHALKTIERNAGQLIGLLEALLDQTKLGWTPLRRRHVDLVDLVTSEVRSIQPMADERGVHLSVALDTPALEVDGDEVQLRRVVLNLLVNAVKFTPPQGRIDCRLWRTDGRAGLAITDNGPGMTPELLTRVFDPYVQGPDQRLQADAGLGLGLTIVRHLVELHGGTVTASSAGPGRGATFTVLLPALPSIAPAAEARQPAPRPHADASPAGPSGGPYESETDSRRYAGPSDWRDGHNREHDL